MDDQNVASNSNPTLDDGTSPAATKKSPKGLDPDKATVNFVDLKKKDMKKSQYRERFDMLSAEIDQNIINTFVSYGQKLYEKSGWGSMVFYNKMSNGAYDINVYPQKITDRDQNRSGVPVSQEPIALSKILIATSVLAGKLPDCQVISDDKVYSKAAYELWKRTWLLKGGNGQNTLSIVYQNLLTYGWAAWRCYPRRVSVQRKGVEKLLFDDVYREPMDPNRTWLGLGQNNGDYWSAFEVYYEKDMLKSEFFEKYPEAKNNKRKLEYCTTSQEAKDENQEKARHSVTIGYYENVLLNRYIVKCGGMIIYDGELPNDDSYGSIIVARCFIKNQLDPYGVGLYEMMRGNTALFTYINSLNAQQVEAEIFPLLFGPQVQNGTATYKRSPNVINPKNPGTTIDVIKTSGNVQQGVAFAQQQKTAIEENTGVNNILAGNGGESTLGSTVILKEAASNRLTPPKNSMMNGLQTDAHIAMSWIEQTYSVDKVFLIDSQEDVAEFAKQNPDYFVDSQDITDDDGIPTGKQAIVASKNLRLNFDFTPDGEILEDVAPRTVTAKDLFTELKNYNHKSNYIEFLIDPDSMLLPSLEIQKQTMSAMFPVITNQVTLIFNLRHAEPEAASAQLRALEKFLEIQQQDIYDYIPKAMYDQIIALQPSQTPFIAPTKPIDKSKMYQFAPPDVQREIEQAAGLQPSEEAGVPSSTPGAIPPATNLPGIPEPQMAAAGGNNIPQGNGGSPAPTPTPSGGVEQPQQGAPAAAGAAVPIPAGNVPRPQAPMGAAIDASLGRAAKLPELKHKIK